MRPGRVRKGIFTADPHLELSLRDPSDWNVGADVAEGRLVQVLDDWTTAYPGLCLYYLGRRHVSAGLRTFIDLIKRQSRTLGL